MAGWPWPYGRGRVRWSGSLHVVGVAGWPGGRGHGRTVAAGCLHVVGWPAGRMAVAVVGWPGCCLSVVGRPAGRMAGLWPDGRAMPKLCRAKVEPRLASAL